MPNINLNNTCNKISFLFNAGLRNPFIEDPFFPFFGIYSVSPEIPSIFWNNRELYLLKPRSGLPIKTGGVDYCSGSDQSFQLFFQMDLLKPADQELGFRVVGIQKVSAQKKIQGPRLG